MGKMADLEAQIRDIVKDEIRKAPFINPRYMEERRGVQPVRVKTIWNQFETDLLVDHFDKFCFDMATKTGRSYLSISCKIRHLIEVGRINTW